MKNFWSVIFGLMLALPAWAAGDFQEGKQYAPLAAPQPVSSDDKIEVIEFFWYGCPHCYHLEPELDKWLEKKPDDVEFVRIPAVLGPSWELLARGWYTAQLLGVEDKIHRPLFDHLHKDRKRIRTVEDLKAFFASQGVSGEDFDKTYNSFAVVTKTGRAKQMISRYGLNSVPTLVVAGKYRTGPSMAGGNAAMLEVVDYLVEQERLAGKQATAAAAQ